MGGLAIYYYPSIIKNIYRRVNFWDDTSSKVWDDSFTTVSIPSSVDGVEQKAVYFKSLSSSKQPLLVSLHTWSGTYEQKDPLSAYAVKHNWNYIHPDFRGPNRTTEACLSQKVIKDIDDSIKFAIDNGGVDSTNIFIAGASGGGYVTIGYFMKGQYPARAYLAWVPITDLNSWYWQSVNRNEKYAQDILDCTSNNEDMLNLKEMKDRSPIYFDIPKIHNSGLEIYHGINDGYTGSVPISHSILFYNKLVNFYGLENRRVTQQEIVRLFTRGVEVHPNQEKIGTRTVFYTKKNPVVSLTIFDGGHEMLPKYCFQRLKKISEKKPRTLR